MFRKFLNLFRSRKPARPLSEQVQLSSEEMCGIDPESMSKEKIKKKLAKLYSRHNQAVSSLNPELRKEAKIMLEAIVDCRQRYVDVK